MKSWIVIACLGFGAAAQAQAVLEGPALAAATADPAIARCLIDVRALDIALTTTGSTAMADWVAPDLYVNSPQNSVHGAVRVVELRTQGRIRYDRYVRTLELATVRPGGEVMLMGRETVDPQGPGPQQGQRVERRFTDIWRPGDGRCKLAVRQATIIRMTPLAK